jgi:hypothetical protein
MARLSRKGWRLGALMFCRSPIFVQCSEDGWFARHEDEDHKLMMVSGPWGSQYEAECKLLDAMHAIADARPEGA